MIENLFTNVKERLNWFYDNVTNRNNRVQKDLKNTEPSVNTLAEMAINYALFPSVNHSCKYLGRNNEAHQCFSNRVMPLVKDFIINGYNKGDYNMNYVYDLIINVKTLYHLPEYAIQDYTIGNAQKLVSMSFKFFFTLLDHFNIRTITNGDNFMEYNYCVIDRQVKNLIKNNYPDINLRADSWSTWDDIEIFKTLQNDLFNACHNTYDNNVFYELLAWVREN